MTTEAHTDDQTKLAQALAERDAALEAIERVRALHPKHEVIICGAMAEVPHRHGSEREPYPIRPVTCTKLQDHEGSHRDASCCWNFEEFDNVAAYKSDEWADRSICSHCQTAWPCPTVAALDGAPEPEWEYGLLNPQAPDGGKLQGGAHLISANREHILAQQRRGHPAILAVRRRKAGPWLPVEGESK